MGYSDGVGENNCSSFTASAAARDTFVAIMTKALATRPIESADLVLGHKASPPRGVRFPVWFKHFGMRLLQSILEFGLHAAELRLRLRR